MVRLCDGVAQTNIIEYLSVIISGQLIFGLLSEAYQYY